MPTNTPIPTLSTGNVVTAGNWNDITACNTQIGLFGADVALSGSKPVLTAPNWQVQSGKQAVVLTSGVGTLTFPNAFPNGLLGITFAFLAGGGASQATFTTPTASSVSISCYQANGTPLGSVTQTVSYIAIGF